MADYLKLEHADGSESFARIPEQDATLQLWQGNVCVFSAALADVTQALYRPGKPPVAAQAEAAGEPESEAAGEQAQARPRRRKAA